MRKSYPLFLFTLVLLCCTEIYAQDDSINPQALALINRVSNKSFNLLELKYQKLKKKLSDYSAKSLKRLQKQEQKLRKKLTDKDSLAAKAIFGDIEAKYTAMLQKVQNPVASHGAISLSEYLPGLDSVQASFNFISIAGAKIPGVPAEKIQQLISISGQLKSLQSQFQQASDINKFIKERKRLLQEQLSKHSLGKELAKLNKQVYYYQQQVNEYKQIFSDPDKLEQKLLSVVREIPAFKEFMSKNSMLSQLFPMPNGYGTADALLGLQTRISVQQQLSQQFGGSGASQQQYIQQQVQQAQGELNKLKDKINKLGGDGEGDLEMPDFKPNTQKTKTFWKRIEYGANIQSQRSNFILPATTDIALTAGYKLNDKSVIGIGAGYKLGWGKDISHIHITSQGASARSFLDFKLKGSVWVSSGFEMNYQTEFTRVDQLQDLNTWQKSGLLGLMKKYKIGKKAGNLQLLWDFLSYSQMPKTQAFKFRIGYNF